MWSPVTSRRMSSDACEVHSHAERHPSAAFVVQCDASVTLGREGLQDRKGVRYDDASSTPESTVSSPRDGAVTTAEKRPPSFQMDALRVSPGKTTPANRAP